MVPKYRKLWIKCAVGGALLLPAIWWSFYVGFREYPALWFATSDGWASYDPRSVLPLLGVILGCWFMLMTWRVLDRVAAYVVMIAAGSSTAAGWYEGWMTGLASESTGLTWTAVGSLFAIAGVVLLPHGVRQLRHHYGYPERGRSDRATALGRPHGWWSTPEGETMATVAFNDANGTRYDVPTTIPSELRHKPVVAIYGPHRPGHPDSFHIGALIAPEDEVPVLWRALKEQFPASGDDLLWEDSYTQDPGVALQARLARVAERRRNGELTADEFTTAKWAALAEHVANGEVTRHN